MQKPFSFSDLTSTRTEAKNDIQPAKSCPVELDLSVLGKVSGGLGLIKGPNDSWAVTTNPGPNDSW